VALLRFDGWIAGIGTESGTRIVLGHWPISPFGPVSDLMVEEPAGHRTLFASRADLAEFVAATYTFDAVRVLPVDVLRDGPDWQVAADDLDIRFTHGRRGLLGRLLRAVPGPVAHSNRWTQLIDLPARMVMPGVHTYGTAGNGRHEWYAARDLHPLVSVAARLHGHDLGGLAPVEPPVRFGFGSTPRAPSLVRITTTIRL
jgi:hypothetical protein